MDGFKKESDTFDLIIRNGLLVDGTGNKLMASVINK